MLHFLLHLYKRHGKLLSFQGFQVCNRVRIPDVSLIFKNTIISIVFLFIFYVTHEYIKQYADVAELADAPDLGSGVYDVQVQVLSSAFYLNHKDCKGTYHSLCTPLAEKQRTSSFSNRICIE